MSCYITAPAMTTNRITSLLELLHHRAIRGTEKNQGVTSERELKARVVLCFKSGDPPKGRIVIQGF